MWVTLYTDASYDGNQAGWGVWVRHAQGRIVEKGRCPSGIQDSNAAELYAILMGAKIVLEQVHPIARVTGLLVNSDSQTALEIVKFGARPPRRVDFAQLQKAIVEPLDAENIRRRCKWVKAHQKSQDTRSWLNNAVDRLAGSGRKSN